MDASNLNTRQKAIIAEMEAEIDKVIAESPKAVELAKGFGEAVRVLNALNQNTWEEIRDGLTLILKMVNATLAVSAADTNNN